MRGRLDRLLLCLGVCLSTAEPGTQRLPYGSCPFSSPGESCSSLVQGRSSTFKVASLREDEEDHQAATAQSHEKEKEHLGHFSVEEAEGLPAAGPSAHRREEERHPTPLGELLLRQARHEDTLNTTRVASTREDSRGVYDAATGPGNASAAQGHQPHRTEVDAQVTSTREDRVADAVRQRAAPSSPAKLLSQPRPNRTQQGAEVQHNTSASSVRFEFLLKQAASHVHKMIDFRAHGENPNGQALGSFFLVILATVLGFGCCYLASFSARSPLSQHPAAVRAREAGWFGLPPLVPASVDPRSARRASRDASMLGERPTSMPPAPVEKHPAPETQARRRSVAESLFPLHSGQGSAQGTVDTQGPLLSPELLVPDGSSCTLMVPRLSGRGTRQTVVEDARGLTVFRINAVPGRLTLANANGSQVFASCRERKKDAGLELAVHRGEEDAFGVLKLNPSRAGGGGGYVLLADGCGNLYFRGDHLGGSVNVTDEQGQLVAMSEPAHSRRSVRVGPLVDAGLITLLMLGLDILESVNDGTPT